MSFAGGPTVDHILYRSGTSLTDGDAKRDIVLDLSSAIDALVDQGTLEQLVIYFSGHAFLNNGSEHWMLSHAPDNPNEAVNLAESTELAPPERHPECP